MNRRRAALLSALSLVLTVGGCRSDGEEKGTTGSARVDADTRPGAKPEPAFEDPGAGTRYARSLEDQLDLVPPDADGFLVVRDFRPLIAQARVLEALMAGPLRRAIPALAKLGGGTGAKRLEQLEQAQQLLALVLAGIEGAGVELDKGAVVALGASGPVLVFAASDVDKLLALASLASGGEDLADACRPVAEQAGWYACSLGGAEALAEYAPAKQGGALAERLRERVGFDDLEPINVAMSIARGPEPLDTVLRTDPDLWELSGPMAGASMASLEDELPVRPGPATALRALVPGTSFAWARLDPELIGSGVTGLDALDASLLSGELFLGVSDQPDGIIARVGTTDETKAIAGIEAMTKLLPEGELEPEDVPDLRLSFDRARLELEGRSLPSIGIVAAGPTAEGWATSLGLAPRGRVWAAGDYLSFALGQSQAIPAALATKRGPGPSSSALAALPSSLAGALTRGEVGFVAHLVLDHWQAPPSDEELDALLVGLGPEARPAAASIFAAFDVLAPWSSVDLWARRVSPDARWSLNVSLVPFAAPAEGIGADEQAAVEVALSSALAEGKGEQVYRELAGRFPDSVHAPRYRARTGDAPAHHAAIGMIELGLLGALVLPVIEAELAPSSGSEAPAQTQSILGAALQARERAGRCKALVGKAGPTPSFELSCLSAPGGKCSPSEDLDVLDGEGRYPLTEWTDDPLWAAIGYQPRAGAGHRGHYSLEIAVQGGQCEISVLAEVEVQPGTYATYRRVARVDRDGATTLVPLEISARAD